ncbi:MAG: translocation protein TolB [Oligoflexia bacterium]|nr:translocation protein TolB [Oligoflexia bacterium]
MRKAIPFFASFLVASSFFNFSHAADQPYIAVGEAKTKKTVIALPEIRGTSDLAKYTKAINETVTNDLLYMDLFQVLGPAATIENAANAGIVPSTFKFSDWSSIGAEFLFKAQIGMQGEALTLEAYLYDVPQAKEVFGKRYVASTSDVNTIAHTVANNIVEALTGQRGIFLTKIAMTCSTRSGKKEIFMMNFDGSEPKQVTQHHSISFAPAWSPDSTKLAYSVYTRHRGNIKNIDLYEFDFTTSTYRMISNRKGINSGAAYSPDGQSVTLTMSFLGNPEIFTLTPATSTVTRLTKSLGFDVDPSWSPDGKTLAFVSSRSGKPMVYRMNADGSNPQRLTYAGVYNATPNWSPQGNKIVFAGWLEKHFDVFTMNPDGSHIERLTKNEGSNEDPFFSPDGNFITFSSNRAGGQNVYVMNADGSFVKRLTYGMGNCTAPKWSNPPK